MNYFAHGYQYLDDPFFVAGTAVPDWLSVVDRRVRVTSKLARQFVADGDPRVAAVAAGIVQHHHDDAWFHGTASFAKLALGFSKGIRELFPDDTSMRPSLLGHILVEVLLDVELIALHPGRLEAYYEVLDGMDAALISRAVNRMARRSTEHLEAFIPRFSAERFLYDYAEDGKLLKRLNHVLRRVGMPGLPEPFCDFLPGARRLVSDHRAQLMAGES